MIKENVVAKALTKGLEPDHATIAAFVSTNIVAVEELFTQVLLQCSELKLITGEMFAIDGCKLPSNASKEWSGKMAELETKRDKLKKYIVRIVEQHKKLDKDAKAKKQQDKYPKTMGNGKERRKRAVERLEKKLQKLDEFLKDAKPKIGVSGEEVKTNIIDPQSAFIKTDEGYIQGYNGVTVSDSGNQIIVCAQAIGSGPESGSLPGMLDSLKENMHKVTKKKDPLKNALVCGDTGFFTEKNLQEAAERKIAVLIPDPQFRQRDPYFAEKKDEKVKKQMKKFTIEDFIYDVKKNSFTCPAGNVLTHQCHQKLRNNTGHKYLAKSGVCKNCSLLSKCINVKSSKNPRRALFIADKKYAENLSEKMKEKIDEPVNRELYSRRMQIIEPVFANIRHCKGMHRFMLRGEEKVNNQWQLYCIVHNISKCTKPLTDECFLKGTKKRKNKVKSAA